jgi:hypothetical protein
MSVVRIPHHLTHLFINFLLSFSKLFQDVGELFILFVHLPCEIAVLDLIGSEVQPPISIPCEAVVGDDLNMFDRKNFRQNRVVGLCFHLSLEDFFLSSLAQFLLLLLLCFLMFSNHTVSPFGSCPLNKSSFIFALEDLTRKLVKLILTTAVGHPC